MAQLTRRTVLAGLAGLAAMPPRAAHAAWPERSITLTHGLVPGGGVDVTARIIAEGLSRRLGQQVVVESKPGAGGTLAAAQVARAAPDGYALGFVPASHAVSHAMYKTLPYRTIEDFAFVGMATEFPFVIVTHAEHPIRTMTDLLRLAREQATPLLCGLPGRGTSQHLLLEHLTRLARIDIQQVPFRGGNQSLTELLGKRIDLLIDPPIALLPQIKSGALHAIAVTGANRFSGLPAVGTVAEAGFPGFNITSWVGIVAPAALPEPILTRLNTELSALVAEPAMAERIRTTGAEPAPMTPTAFKARVIAEVARWSQVVTDAKIEQI